MEVVTVLAFVLAIIGGFKLLHSGMAFLNTQFDIHGQLLPYLSFILIFIGIVLIVNLLGKLLKKVLNMTLLGPVDSIAGAIIAMIKWSFGISVLFWLTHSFGLQLPAGWTENSVFYPFLITWAPRVVAYFSSILPFAEDLFQLIRELLQNGLTT